MVDTERGLDRAGHLQGGKLPMHQGQGVGVAGVGIIRQLCGDVCGMCGGCVGDVRGMCGGCEGDVRGG